MATSSVKKVEFVILELTTYEAHWLRVVLQNPLKDQHPDDEAVEDSNTRQAIFNALNEQT